jgi:hypothetical protein
MRARALLRPLGILLCLVFGIAGADAQPGQTPVPPTPAPPTHGTPPPAQDYPPYGLSHGRRSNYHLLTYEERALLAEGEITLLQTLVGGGVAWTFGFGLGHAVQGRYEEIGWKFTLAEGAAGAGFVVGLLIAIDPNSRYPSETGERVFIASAIAFGVLRIWETIDALTAPGEHNKKVRAVRTKAFGYQPRYGFYLAPTTQGGGGIAGLRATF